MTTIEHANALYHTLRQLKGRDFDENEPLTMFGIRCEIDYNNPHKFKLFEDITNKLAIPYAEFKELEEKK